MLMTPKAVLVASVLVLAPTVASAAEATAPSDPGPAVVAPAASPETAAAPEAPPAAETPPAAPAGAAEPAAPPAAAEPASPPPPAAAEPASPSSAAEPSQPQAETAPQEAEVALPVEEAVSPEQQNMDDMLTSLEEIESMVFTASRTAQKIETAPGVVTVITKDDIRIRGYRTLADVLFSVPGYSHVQDNNEHIVAVRGVFATTNHKVLVLRDGHRLNEFLFENVEPDYSISLDNIRRIEIVRGPGGSLYGNAALTVVNLLTEDGSRSDKHSLKLGVGNYGQQLASGNFRKHWGEGHVLLFGSYAATSGQKVALENGSAIVDRYPASFDVGFKLNQKIVTLSGSLRRSAYTQPKGNGGQTIDQDELFHPLEQTFNYGYLDLEVAPVIVGVKLSLRHFYDYSTYNSWQMRLSPTQLPPHGNLFSLDWAGSRAGIEYSATYGWKSGDALAGLTFERRSMDDSYYNGNDADPATMVRGALVPEGVEYNGAAFAQVQQQLLEGLQLNVGARFDYYDEFGGSFNPRTALVYSPFDMLTAKVVYARAFQAASYFYRKSNPGLGYGSADQLDPEVTDSVQMSLRLAEGSHWSAEGIWFWNQMSNLITRDASVTPNIYKNFGRLTVQGVEVDGKVQFGPVQGFANYTFLDPVVTKSEPHLLQGESLKFIPSHAVNGGVAYRASNLCASVSGNWTSRIGAGTKADPNFGLPGRFLLNASIAMEDVPEGARLALSVYNLLNNRWELAGSVPPFPQPGLWLLVTAEYAF